MSTFNDIVNETHKGQSLGLFPDMYSSDNEYTARTFSRVTADDVKGYLNSDAGQNLTCSIVNPDTGDIERAIISELFPYIRLTVDVRESIGSIPASVHITPYHTSGRTPSQFEEEVAVARLGRRFHETRVTMTDIPKGIDLIGSTVYPLGNSLPQDIIETLMLVRPQKNVDFVGPQYKHHTHMTVVFGAECIFVSTCSKDDLVKMIGEDLQTLGTYLASL